MAALIIVLVILAIIVALILIIVHLGFRAPRVAETSDPARYGLDFIPLAIPSVTDSKLFGWLLPVAGSTETIVLLHGWGGNAELMLPLAVPFVQAGINVLLIDSRNHGRSDSDSFSSMPRFAEDLGNSINWLKQHHTQRCQRIALLGHSVGAAAVLLEASRRQDIQAVISVSAFAHPDWMMRRYLKSFSLPSFIIYFILRYVEWVIAHRFEHIAPINTVCAIQCPLLLVHGTQDSTVPIEDAHAIKENCPQADIKLIEVEEAEHDSVELIEQHAHRLIDFLINCGFSLTNGMQPDE